MDILAVLIFILACGYLAYTDITERILPNAITIPLVLAGLVYHLYMGDIKNSLLGFAVASIVYLVTAFRGGIGGGDVKMGAAVGAWLGYPDGMWVIIAGSLLAVIYGLINDPKSRGWVKLTLTMIFLRLTGTKINVPARTLSESAEGTVPYGTFLALAVFIYAVITVPDMGTRVLITGMAVIIIVLAIVKGKPLPDSRINDY